MNKFAIQEHAEKVFSNFKLEVPEYYNFAYDTIDNWAKTDRNKLAMIWVNQQGEEKKFTFQDFSKLSNQAANLLLKYGIGKGDRIFLMLPRAPEWWIFSLAIIKIGAVQCPSPTLLTPHDLKQRIKLGKFKFIITDQDNAPKFDEIYDQCPTLSGRLVINGARNNWISYENEIAGRSTLSRHEVKATFKIKTKSTDPALIFFTSGTSKMPKAVMHTHSYPVGHRITAELWHNLKPDDVHLTLSDTGWAKSAWGSYYGQWLAGGCVFVYDIRGKFHPEEILPLLEKYEITSFCAPPTVYRMLVLNDLSKFDFRELRHCYAAGEPLHAETVKLWQEGTGLTIHEGYGQTETVCVIAQFPGVPIRPGSMGIASPGWNVELHDDTGTPVKQGEEGRIAVKIAPERPIGLLAKYLYNEEANSQAFINDYYYTGDKAWQDEDGYFWFVGRSDDIIKSSGYRIGPSEVEDALMKHPSVQEVGVVGAPDTMRGAKVKAYVVLNKGFEPTETLVKELQNHTKELTAPYKYPREIEFMNKLPKTFSGKIKRDLLRKHAETGENGWETA